MKSFFHSLASALISVPVALALSVLALGPGVHAASFPAAKTVALAVDPTTGEIKGPVDAETFKSANNLGGGGGGGGSYSFTLPLLDTLGTVSIRTGSTVKVIFRSSAAEVELTGIARSTAKLGEPIQIEVRANNTDKTIHQGTVISAGVVEVKI